MTTPRELARLSRADALAQKHLTPMYSTEHEAVLPGVFEATTEALAALIDEVTAPLRKELNDSYRDAQREARDAYAEGQQNQRDQDHPPGY